MFTFYIASFVVDLKSAVRSLNEKSFGVTQDQVEMDGLRQGGRRHHQDL